MSRAPVQRFHRARVAGLACVVALGLACRSAQAQDLDAYDRPLETLEGLAEDGGDDAERAAENALLLLHRPVNVNTATADELAAVPGLSARMALLIVLHRQRHGPFPAVDSLRAVNGLGRDVLGDIHPYLTVNTRRRADGPRAESVALSRMGDDVRLEAVQLVGWRSESDEEARYTGGPLRASTRLRAHGERLSLNLTLDKDPGEAFRWRPDSGAYGYDFISGHVALRNLGRIRALVAGDFAADFGQGLVFSSGSGFGKGGDPAHAGNRLVPYRSTDEHRFFRGAGLTLAATRRVEVTLFGSRRRLDAGVDTPGCLEPVPRESCVDAPVTTGLHRTPGELERRGRLEASVTGGGVTYRRDRLLLGITAYRHGYAVPVARADEPHRHFDFAGQSASGASVHGRLLWGNTLLFGEAATGARGGLGAVAGVQAALSRGSEVAVVVRSYPARFVSLYGDAFGERGGPPRNEQGVFVRLHVAPHARWRLEGYFDQYSFPWLRFGVHRPSSGFEAYVRAEYRPRRWCSIQVQGRSETVEAGAVVDDPGGRAVHGLAPRARHSVRAGAEYIFSPALRLRARLEAVRSLDEEGARERGMMLYQDVRWRPARIVQIDARVGYFDTSGYTTRVYAYEQDVLYAFSSPAYSGRGERWYVLLRLDPVQAVTLQIKLGAVRDAQARPDEAGPVRRDVKALLRVRF